MLPVSRPAWLTKASDNGEDTRLEEKSLRKVQRHKAFTAAMDRALNSSRPSQNVEVGKMHDEAKHG